MANKRIYYATKGLAIKKTGATPGSGVLQLSSSGINPSNLWEVPRGIQSVTVNTNFGLDPIFQQGQQATYELSEKVPEIAVTINRVLDATMPLYLIASDSTGATVGTPLGLAARNSSYKCDIALHIYPEAVVRASGAPDARVLCSGMFMSSVNYSFPVEGPATEEISFVGNNKFWAVANGGTAPNSIFPSGGTVSIIPAVEDATTQGLGGTQEVTRRQDINLSTSTLPADIPSADQSGIQSITISADLGREEIFALGAKEAYTRVIKFPLEVSCSFDCVTSIGDKKEAVAATNNLTNRTIVVKTRQGLILDLGTKNKLESVEFSGGDTGGGNVAVKYNYKNFNDLTISNTGYLGL